MSFSVHGCLCPENRPRGRKTVMTTPRTELDTRFSDPAAQPTSWEDTLEAIKQAEIFWISTVRTDGRPHVTPLVAVWLDDALHFSTGRDEQKARNLASNPTRRADHGRQRLAERPRRSCRGRGGPRHRCTATRPARRSLGTKVGRAMAIRGQSGWLSTRRRDRARVRCPPSESPCLHQGRLQPHSTSLLRRRRCAR